MSTQSSNCAILVDRNAETSEAIRGLLESEFDSVYLVANEKSLAQGVERLNPRVVVVDQLIGPDAVLEVMKSVRRHSPDAGVVVLATHEHNMITEALLSAGADAVVLKRCAGTDLFEALMAVANGKRYVSQGLNAVMT